MISLFVILITIALLDSTSMIPLALIPMAAILGGKQYISGALGFILGIFVVYFFSGILLLFGFDYVFEVIGPSFSRWWDEPKTLELVFQTLVGICVLLYAWKQYKLPKIEVTEESSNKSEAAFTPISAFTLGITLTIVGVPGAIPYFGGIEQILRADLNLVASMAALLVYNIAFVTVFFTMLLIRIIAPNKTELVFGSISSVMKRWGKPAIVTLLVILGSVFIADSVGWLFGYPLLTVG
ncbi:GAP family protein [Vibrio lamellibrachiae]|uniref:GAP family protein n=1 Tax=Vibrio lamellibrachiae TaxID=2910253 RepID=UPI003D0A4289